MNDNLPLLHSVYIPGYYSVSPSLSGTNANIFYSASNLCRLRPDTPPSTNLIRRLQVPWGRLTRLQLVIRSSQQFLGILKMCPNIEDLTAECSYRWADSKICHPPKLHTKLTSLNISSFYYLSFLFAHLSLPSLRNLSL